MTGIMKPGPKPEAEVLNTKQQKDMELLGQYVGQLAGMLMALRQEMEQMKRDSAQRITVSHQQVKTLQEKARARAEQLCAKYGLDMKRHGAALRTAIKKAVLKEYGVQDLHDLPAGCFEAAKEQIAVYSNYALIRKRRSVEGGA